MTLRKCLRRYGRRYGPTEKSPIRTAAEAALRTRVSCLCAEGDREAALLTGPATERRGYRQASSPTLSSAGGIRRPTQ